MAEGKKQHTVPRFILRAFHHASSEKLIGVFHLPRAHFMQPYLVLMPKL
jgi:hypothetical protein